MNIRLACVCCTAMLSFAGQVAAQLIPVKSAPIAEGDQFTFLPSANRGMAGVSVALADSLSDPFSNPATAARLRRPMVFGSPSFYSLTKDGGNGSTLPVGALLRAGAAFAAFSFAVQELNPAGDNTPRFETPVRDVASSILLPGSAIRQRHTNRYFRGLAGSSLGTSGISVAGAVSVSELNGMDGVDALYVGSERVDQRGNVVDLRMGALKDWTSGRSVEALLLHRRYAMAHEVSYLDFIWDPGQRFPVAHPRVDGNYDRTHTWGVHLKYRQPLADSTWRVGALVTANRQTQPTVPRLGIMNIVGDPGAASAFDGGLGIARTDAHSTVALDAIYEPIWSHGPDYEHGGYSRYRFANGIVRAGASHDFAMADPGTTIRVQAGAQLRGFSYSRDNYATTPLTPRSHGRWNEWTHAASASLRTSQFTVHYLWRLTSGVQRLGTDPPPLPLPVAATAVDPFGPFFAPQPPQLRMLPIRVTTQQFSISVPMP